MSIEYFPNIQKEEREITASLKQESKTAKEKEINLTFTYKENSPKQITSKMKNIIDMAKMAKKYKSEPIVKNILKTELISDRAKAIEKETLEIKNSIDSAFFGDYEKEELSDLIYEAIEEEECNYNNLTNVSIVLNLFGDYFDSLEKFFEFADYVNEDYLTKYKSVDTKGEALSIIEKRTSSSLLDVSKIANLDSKINIVRNSFVDYYNCLCEIFILEESGDLDMAYKVKEELSEKLKNLISSIYTMKSNNETFMEEYLLATEAIKKFLRE